MPPALQSLARAVLLSFVAVGVLALVAGFAASYLRGAWKQVLVLGLVALLAAPRWGSTAELLQDVAMNWAGLLLLWWAAQRIFRFNFLAYLLTSLLLVLTNDASELLRQPNYYFRTNGALLLVAALLLLLWPLLKWRLGGTQTSPRVSDSAT
jgi:hypothetical protein